MKNLFYLFAIICIFSCSQTKSIISSGDNANSKLYTIIKIQNDYGFKFIYAQRGDSIFKIMTDRKHPKPSNSKKIKIGEKYNLDLSVISLSSASLHVRLYFRVGAGAQRKTPRLKKEFHNATYKAKNIHGSYIVDNENTKSKTD